jgi:signal transduction histidine kinase
LAYTPAGGWVITISNIGEAIAPEHLDQLFDRFYRVDPSRQRQGEGAGLGLAIVKSIVELHGGMIRAASTPVANPSVETDTTGQIPRVTLATVSFAIAIHPNTLPTKNQAI